MPHRKPTVTYYRVSTQKQGQSGLGLEAQQAAVQTFLNGASQPVRKFVEIESGRKNERPVLAEVLAYCRQHGCQLVIAKLDRLARDVHFISGLMKAGVEFVAADMPTVNRMTVHVVAAVAEEEARATSQRTKAALAALKARNPDRRLGNPQGFTAEAIQAGTAKRVEKAAAREARIIPTVKFMRDNGKTLAQIAAHLTELGIHTPRGGQWNPTQVSRVLGRLSR